MNATRFRFVSSLFSSLKFSSPCCLVSFIFGKRVVVDSASETTRKKRASPYSERCRYCGYIEDVPGANVSNCREEATVKRTDGRTDGRTNVLKGGCDRRRLWINRHDQQNELHSHSTHSDFRSPSVSLNRISLVREFKLE